MTDCESWVFHHRFYNLTNLFRRILGDINSLWSLVVTVIFLALSPPLPWPSDRLFGRKEHWEEGLCTCVFLCMHPRPLALCSIMCKAPHKADQAETQGSFLHTLLSVIFFPRPSQKGKGRWDLMEVIISESPACHPPHHPHISIPLYAPLPPRKPYHLHHPTCIKEGGRGPSLSESPF